MNRSAEKRSDLALHLLGTATGMAVLVAGFLYVVGILVTSAELWHAGVSIRDTIPILSLEQLLARGVSLVLPTLALLAVAVVGVALYFMLEKRLQDDVRGRLAELAALMPSDEREAWLAEATAANTSTHWDRLSASLKAAQPHASPATKREIATLRRRATLANLPGNAVFLLACAVVVFLPPALAVALVVSAVAWVAVGARPLWQLLAVAYAVLILALLIEPWADARDLPTAMIVTDRGETVCGEFLFIKDGEWFVVTPSHTLRVVQPDEVRSARIMRGDARRSVLTRIADAVSGGRAYRRPCG